MKDKLHKWWDYWKENKKSIVDDYDFITLIVIVVAAVVWFVCWYDGTNTPNEKWAENITGIIAILSFIVLTTALILTFSPAEKGQRLNASLYAVVCRANPVAGAWWFRGSRREFVGGNLSPPKNQVSPAPPGLKWFYQLSHGFTVGYYLTLLRS